MAKPHDPKQEIIRKNLKAFREQAKLTTDEAAKTSGVTVDNLRRYESGKVRVPSDALHALAAAYGRTMDHFYMPDPPKPNLQDRDGVHLWFTPGVDVDEPSRKFLMDTVAEVNRRMRSKKQRKS